MLDKHARGEDTADDFREFMDRHGHLFDEDPQNVEELIDALARRAAAAQRLMSSLTPAQREELAGLMASALGDPELAAQLAALSSTLQALRPDLAWQRAAADARRAGLGYAEAAGALGELADLDDLLDALAQDHPGATLDDIDVETGRASPGISCGAGRPGAAAARARAEPPGLADPGRRQRPHASPRRRCAGSARRRCARCSRTWTAAAAASTTSGTPAPPARRPAPRGRWEFGDEQPLDVVRTVGNAVRRGERPDRRGGPRGAGRGLRLLVEDFEVVETERRASAAVALCVDLSYSMIAEGRWGPMKQTALALAHLVATRFPQDALQIIGFGRYATPLRSSSWPASSRSTSRARTCTTRCTWPGVTCAGTPTASRSSWWSPTASRPRTWTGGERATSPTRRRRGRSRPTVAEVDALTRYGAPINVFMLGEDPGLRRFMDAVARRNGGRVFTPGLDRLGSYVVSDYLRARRGARRWRDPRE